MIKLFRESKQKKIGRISPFAPQVMRSVACLLLVLIQAYTDFYVDRVRREITDTLTSYGNNMDSCVMFRRWLRSGSYIQILSITGICYEYTTNGISCEVRRKVELSMVRSITSYHPYTTHLIQREFIKSVVRATDIENIPVYSYTPWTRQLSYTQLNEELSRLSEYLNSEVIIPIDYEYLMSIFMNSYTAWKPQLARMRYYLAPQ